MCSRVGDHLVSSEIHQDLFFLDAVSDDLFTDNGNDNDNANVNDNDNDGDKEGEEDDKSKFSRLPGDLMKRRHLFIRKRKKSFI